MVGNTTSVISDVFYVASTPPETRIKGVYPSINAVSVDRVPGSPVVDEPPSEVEPTPPPVGVSEPEMAELLEKATTLRVSGDYEAAEGVLREAIERDPNTVKARNELGALLTEMGRQGEAVEILKDARVLSPTNRDVLYNLGAAYYLLGRYRESVAALESLAELNPQNEAVLWSLAKAHFKADEIESARKVWEKIVALDVPGSTFSPRARKALASFKAESAG
jgi:tetratricopeptide (TPR) repeat protein